MVLACRIGKRYVNAGFGRADTAGNRFVHGFEREPPPTHMPGRMGWVVKIVDVDRQKDVPALDIACEPQAETPARFENDIMLLENYGAGVGIVRLQGDYPPVGLFIFLAEQRL